MSMKNVLLRWEGDKHYMELKIGSFVVATISGDQEDDDENLYYEGWIGEGQEGGSVYDTGPCKSFEEAKELIEKYLTSNDAELVEPLKEIKLPDLIKNDKVVAIILSNDPYCPLPIQARFNQSLITAVLSEKLQDAKEIYNQILKDNKLYKDEYAKVEDFYIDYVDPNKKFYINADIEEEVEYIEYNDPHYKTLEEHFLDSLRKVGD